MKSDDVQNAARLQLVVVIAASMMYFCLVLCYGNSIQVWKYIYPNKNNHHNNNKSSWCFCCCGKKHPTISFLCFVAILCGFLVQLWTIVVDLRALTLMKRLKAEGRFHMNQEQESNNNPMMILMAIDIHTELAIQNVLDTFFDIGFVTLGLYVVSLPWGELYKTCVTRRSVVGMVVLVKTVLALRYQSSLRHATNTASSSRELLVPLVVSFSVEFVVLWGILVAWFNTLHGTSILGLASRRRHGNEEEKGYKTYGWFLLLHLVGRIACFLIVVAQVVSKIRADYNNNYDDDIFHEHHHQQQQQQQDNNAAIQSLWQGAVMIVERLTPLLVLTGVAYHWSNDDIDDESAAFQSLAQAPEGDEGIQLAWWTSPPHTNKDELFFFFLFRQSGRNTNVRNVV